MIRVSTTTLEAYRRLLQTEYGTEAELIAQIKGEPFKPSWQMQAGQAWDHVLSWPGYEALGFQPAYGGFTFDAEAWRSAKEHLGPGVWQVKATKQIGPALVVAQVDHIHGMLIDEVKAKFSTPDARDYEQVLQWRFYCLIHDAPVVRYSLFDFSDPKGGYCELRNIISFKFWSYPNLEVDCKRWVSEFLSWAESRALLGYLNRESSTPSLAA